MSTNSPHMEPRIQLVVRRAECDLCRMCMQADGMDNCVTATGNHRAKVMIVQKMPWGARQMTEIQTYLERAGFNPDRLLFGSAIKCRTWEMQPTRTDVKACRQYLAKEIDFIKPDWILALGNEALMSLTGHSGIMKHRGVTYDAKCGSSHIPQVVGTISPAMVHRNPGQKGGFEADLQYFRKLTEGTDVEAENHPGEIHIADTKAKLKELAGVLANAHGVSFDIESTGFDEFAPGASIVCIAFTIWNEGADAPEATWALPLFHPQSPWRNQWVRVLNIFRKYIEKRAKRVAHNGKFDCRWLRHFGWDNIDLTFDTMLAAHVLDENRPKGLKPLARQIFNAPPWAIETSDLLTEPLAEVLEYCGLDTFHAARLYFHFKEQLGEIKNKRKLHLFARLLMPAANEFIGTERHGVWTDAEALMTNWKIAQDELDAINDRAREYVPNDWKELSGAKEINFGPSNFLRWLVFDHLGLPIIARGKDKDDGSPGAPSLAEKVMLELQDTHPLIGILLERTKWYKYTTAFFSAYAEQLDSNSRIHTNFKVTGTVTGRLSSGKADADKVTSRKQIRGANLQQVPRDSFVRGIFGAPPGSYFVEFDYSQIELRIAAFLAREQNMMHLYNQGADIHMAMAMRMTSKPASAVTKEERKMAKAVNFGFLYGMGATKFIGTALQNYGLHVTMDEAQAARTAFFNQFPDLLPWHSRQRSLAHKYKRVQTPLGRVRHLPDIDSPDRGVMAEAERQAINSPVQGLASDLALLSFVLASKKLRARGFATRAIGTVHDAVNYEVPEAELPLVLPLIKNTMENLPLRKWFGLHLDIPIIADAKVGTRWGGAQELTNDQVMDFDLSMIGA